MRHQWVAYAAVIVLSLGFGVAVAGLPSSAPVDPTIAAPDTTTPTPDSQPVDTVLTTEPVETTTTTTPATTTTEQAPTTTEPVPESTTIPAPALPDRADLVVVVANGANIGGLATRTVDELEALGYADVSATDGTTIVDTTIVYFGDPSLEASAARLAVDLGLPPTAIAAIADAPDISGAVFDDLQLLAYLGSDRPR